MNLRLTVEKRARVLASFFFADVNIQNTILGETVVHGADPVSAVDGRSHYVKRKSATKKK